MVTDDSPRATFHSPPEVGHTHTQIHVNIPPVCAHFVDDTRTDAPSRSGMIRRNFGPKTGVSGDLTRARRAHPPSSPPSVAARHCRPQISFLRRRTAMTSATQSEETTRRARPCEGSRTTRRVDLKNPRAKKMARCRLSPNTDTKPRSGIMPDDDHRSDVSKYEHLAEYPD